MFLLFYIFQITWMKREGGLNPRDHVMRVLNKLLASDLQKQLNRTGGYGKTKFNPDLEKILIDTLICVNCFMLCSMQQIEFYQVTKFKCYRVLILGIMKICEFSLI